ncbi:hypothetical protein Pmani_031108 [Petrolisthes manimaculis]|uniref:Immunoglobulin domain-containing protein n=1 Tax=Petrolisthes manimaculis TaxID=1843537 RepID=A0AAE1NWE3_9EUCA|nr:hypothetical protein Pmani_031108 [Petrolisthes manimaculis]
MPGVSVSWAGQVVQDKPVPWLMLAVLLEITGSIAQVEIRELRVPPVALEGDEVKLWCDYEVEDGSSLYSLKWYKDGTEFYSYHPPAAPIQPSSASRLTHHQHTHYNTHSSYQPSRNTHYTHYKYQSSRNTHHHTHYNYQAIQSSRVTPPHTHPSYQPSRPTHSSYQPSRPIHPSYQPSRPTHPSYQPSHPTHSSYHTSRSTHSRCLHYHTLAGQQHHGLAVDCSVSSEREVVLRGVSVNSSGVYQCEVTGEQPNFRRRTLERTLRVFSEVLAHPQVRGVNERTYYKPGSSLNLTCTSPNTHYTPTLTFTINGHQVLQHHLRRYPNNNNNNNHNTTTTTTTLGLYLDHLSREMFSVGGGVLEVRCTAVFALHSSFTTLTLHNTQHASLHAQGYSYNTGK